MATCMYCGSQIPDGLKFCTQCGAALPVEAPAASSDPQQQPPQPPYLQQQPYQQPLAQAQPFNASSQQQVNDSGSIGWGVLGFFFPIVGLVLFLVWKNTKPKCAQVAGIGALVGFLLGLAFTFMI